ncbi:uncharacterized protein B0P05DRAFT_575598 [Gilbertella persicaria]|uniref:uncharacterized protein n=1 Tax=Gilbertella persicaria TaxID=101096 RepID=UPI0022200AF5|nr:uncharacterized protein B0P05DRAFT_575598 [Gilbertella persicaria]KAI8051880.1 hypothetical protein B0P05DRAFT_575598 [Gilbertella persicaria]
MRSYFTSAGGAAVARTITDLRTLKDSHGTHEAAKEVNKFAKLVLYKYCLDNWYDNEKVDAGAQFDIIKEEHKKLFLELNPNENYEQVQFDTEDIKANVDRKRNHEIDLANELAKKLKKRLTTGTSILSDIELEAIRQAEGKAIEIEKELEEESEQTQAEAEQTQAEQVQAEDEEMAT